ncbi:parathyroid hormone 4 isoform X2 [Pimephales promelas]|uniref:parathyroid hormone 4 isoform X2 n=1 Tax=Pimephales promelas TaxID=90988 RepID=UPI001955D3C1|nr:parathyroid hormone 4 isoform X2 [Pimephales promelas]KAG1946213.1 parathyroid hormone-related protein [Pimephales promelas]
MFLMLKTPGSQRLAFMILMVIAAVQCQENERRAVTEHQLMHDRGRSIQSLKRLIWLSSAIEGLHTAQMRTVTPDDPDIRWRSQAPGQIFSQSGHKRALETLLRDMYTPHLMQDLLANMHNRQITTYSDLPGKLTNDSPTRL